MRPEMEVADGFNVSCGAGILSTWGAGGGQVGRV